MAEKCVPDQTHQTSLSYDAPENNNESALDFDSLSSPGVFSPEAKKGKSDFDLSLAQLQMNILNLIKECHEDLA